VARATQVRAAAAVQTCDSGSRRLVWSRPASSAPGSSSTLRRPRSDDLQRCDRLKRLDVSPGRRHSPRSPHEPLHAASSLVRQPFEIDQYQGGAALARPPQHTAATASPSKLGSRIRRSGQPDWQLQRRSPRLPTNLSCLRERLGDPTTAAIQVRPASSRIAETRRRRLRRPPAERGARSRSCSAATTRPGASGICLVERRAAIAQSPRPTRPSWRRPTRRQAPAGPGNELEEASSSSSRTQAHQLSPTISPFSSMSMISAAGCDDSPGIVLMSPHMRYTKPAPTEARASRTGMRHPTGAPFSAESDDSDSASWDDHRRFRNRSSRRRHLAVRRRR